MTLAVAVATVGASAVGANSGGVRARAGPCPCLKERAQQALNYDETGESVHCDWPFDISMTAGEDPVSFSKDARYQPLEESLSSAVSCTFARRHPAHL